MSVDERLRRGLEANASSFVPAGEARLEAVHRRLRRRRAGLVAAVGTAAAVAAVAVTGVLAGGREGADPAPIDSPAPSVSTASAGESSYAGPVIGDSTWARSFTREEALALGVSRAELREQGLGPDDRLRLQLQFLGENYAQSGDYSGTWSIGDQGLFEYLAGGRIRLTSSSPGCPGCIATLRWRVADDQLRLSDMQGDGMLGALDRVMTEGTWRLVEE